MQSQLAQVARTPYGESNVNRLRRPGYRINGIQLEAGGRRSRCYFAVGSVAPPGPDPGGFDDVCFAPGHRLDGPGGTITAPLADPAKIHYAISDPTIAIEHATLEIFVAFDPDPIWSRTLARSEVSDGEHVVRFDGEDEWDGRIVGADSKRFPDGYLTAQHCTYKLKLSLVGAGASEAAVAWTFFHVLVARVELAYGRPEMLPPRVSGAGDHRQVLADLTAQSSTPPAPGSDAKVFLESNIFKKGHSMFDNSLFEQYRALWGDGPLIPLVVTIWIKAASGAEVIAPRALGGLELLWDWESRTRTTGNAFVDQAIDYDQAKSRPKGLCCHVDRGGKRADSSHPVIPRQPGYMAKASLEDGRFPFRVETCAAPRSWAAISYAWTTGCLAGQSGVLFQPSRMAGDRFAVTVYVAHETDASGSFALNRDDDAPLPIHASLRCETGEFEIWRKAHLRGHVQKRAAGMPALDLDRVCASYSDAFLLIENVAGPPQTIPEASWNGAVASAVAGWSPTERLYLEASAGQHAAGPRGIYFRDRDEYVEAWCSALIEAGLTANGIQAADASVIARAAGPEPTVVDAEAAAAAASTPLGYTSPAQQSLIQQVTRISWQHVHGFMNNPSNSLDTDDRYAGEMSELAIELLVEVFDAYLAGSDGVTILQVERPLNLPTSSGIVIGMAEDFPSGTDRRCGFLLMCAIGDVSCGAEKISAHEIGHHLFLPHPPDPAEKQDYRAHDIAVNSCLMSYNFSTSMELCGFCQLRLRGWSKDAIDPDGTKNARV